MDKVELSIIIVNYKSFDFACDAISDIKKHLAALKYEIIIVDNDPKTDDDKKFSSRYKNDNSIKIIKNSVNAGFGAGNNLGAKSASGEYLLLLNPDTKIVDNSVEKMIEFLSKHSEVGALSPLIYQADGKSLQKHFFADFQNLAGMTIKRWQGKQADLSVEFFYVEMITAAAMLLKRELFEKVSGFDEKFFMYNEDDDLCRRISKLGFKNAVLVTAKIIHIEGQSSTTPEKKKYYYESQDYYWQKHYGRFKTGLMKIIRAPYIVLQKIRHSSF